MWHTILTWLDAPSKEKEGGVQCTHVRGVRTPQNRTDISLNSAQNNIENCKLHQNSPKISKDHNWPIRGYTGIQYTGMTLCFTLDCLRVHILVWLLVEDLFDPILVLEQHNLLENYIVCFTCFKVKYIKLLIRFKGLQMKRLWLILDTDFNLEVWSVIVSADCRPTVGRQSADSFLGELFFIFPLIFVVVPSKLIP